MTSGWSFAERYVAGYLRALGCTDPRPLLGTRAYASGRIAMRCRLCNTTLPAMLDVIALEAVADVVARGRRRDTDFFEEDEPVADVVRAFERGQPAVTRRPVAWLTTVEALRACPEGTVLRTGAGHLEALAYRVATTDDWSVTGFESLWDSRHALNVCERWEVVTTLDVEDREERS